MGVKVVLSAGAEFALSKGEARLEGEINGIIDAELGKMGLGDVPITVNLDDISPAGVRDAAINGGITYAETALNEAIDLPVRVRLPRKLTLNELQRSIGFTLPTDLQGGIDLALTLGGQAIAMGVTSLLVGAGVGSVVPGLGTIVGIGVALGISALQSAFKPEPNIVWCTKGWECRGVAPEATPILTWADGLTYYTYVSSVYAHDQASGFCQGGPVGDCQRFWRELLERAAKASLGTAVKMTAVEVDEAYRAFAGAAKRYDFYDAKARGIRTYEYTAYESTFKTMALSTELKERGVSLMQLNYDLEAFNVGRLTDYNGVWKLRNRLLAESDIAAVAVQNSANGLRPTNIYDANVREMVRYADGFKRTAAKLVELARAQQQAVPPVPALPTDPMSVAARAVAPAYLALAECAALYDAWARSDPERALCVDGDTKSTLIGLCLAARAQHITLEQMSAEADKVVAAACARARRGDLWARFRGGFRGALDPLTLWRRESV